VTWLLHRIINWYHIKFVICIYRHRDEFRNCYKPKLKKCSDTLLFVSTFATTQKTVEFICTVGYSGKFLTRTRKALGVDRKVWGTNFKSGPESHLAPKHAEKPSRHPNILINFCFHANSTYWFFFAKKVCGRGNSCLHFSKCGVPRLLHHW
jgi:hypothetical protein